MVRQIEMAEAIQLAIEGTEVYICTKLSENTTLRELTGAIRADAIYLSLEADMKDPTEEEELELWDEALAQDWDNETVEAVEEHKKEESKKEETKEVEEAKEPEKAEKPKKKVVTSRYADQYAAIYALHKAGVARKAIAERLGIPEGTLAGLMPKAIREIESRQEVTKNE